MRITLAASVAINLLFLASIVVARVNPVAQTAAGFSATGTTLGTNYVSEDSMPIDSVPNLVSRLESARFEPDEIRLVVAAWLRGKFQKELKWSGAAFWQRDYSAELEALSFELTVGNRLRRELIDLYGPIAIDTPEFSAAFRPLGPAYDFLSSRAQLDLQQQRLDLVSEANQGRSSSISPARCNKLASTIRWGAPPDEPGAGLSMSERSELRLRVSPLANLLRSAGSADDEASFRHMFELFSALEERTDPTSQARLRREIRQLWGDATFDRIWSARDPLFGPLDQYLHEAGFNQQQILSVYTIVNRSQESLMEAVGRSASNDARLTAIGRIRSNEADELGRLLGTEQAHALQAAMHQAAVRLSNPIAATC